MSHPLEDLVSALEDKQRKLDSISKALRSYEDEKAPLEDLLLECEEMTSDIEPFGLDVKLGEKQQNKLNVRVVSVNIPLEYGRLCI